MNKKTENAVQTLKSITFGTNDMVLSDRFKDETIIAIAEKLLEKGVIFPDNRPNSNPRLENATTLR